MTVDPRNTSRQCPACGHTEKANRPKRDRFKCQRCALEGPADAIAALNIKARAAVNPPNGSAFLGVVKVAQVQHGLVL